MPLYRCAVAEGTTTEAQRALIAKEAGATVSDFSNGGFALDTTEILVTNGCIHNEMISLME